MTKKLLALTMVLVLAAGVAAVAQEDQKALTGSWENELVLGVGNEDISSFNYNGELSVEYVTNGINYSSTSVFGDDGFESQEFGLDTSVGLLDLSSSVNFNVQTPSLAYWKNEATMTLGGVSISDTFLLQKTNSYGAGMDLMFSGETPGGVTVDVNNYFGLEPVNSDDEGEITGNSASDTAISSGYRIVTVGKSGGELYPEQYGGSSMQYVATKLSLEGMGVGCCDFDSETLFSELNGFEYTDFMFTMEAEDFPLTLDTTIGFTPTEKTVDLALGSDLGMEWGCFTVWTSFDGLLDDDTDTSLGLKGFALEEVPLGDVYFSTYTALSGYNVYDLNDSFIEDDDYEEVIRIEKLEKFDLDFTADIYFNITEDDQSDQGGLFGLELFDAEASYALSDQFSLGSGLQVYPDSGLGEVTLSLDYSW